MLHRRPQGSVVDVRDALGNGIAGPVQCPRDFLTHGVPVAVGNLGSQGVDGYVSLPVHRPIDDSHEVLRGVTARRLHLTHDFVGEGTGLLRGQPLLDEREPKAVLKLLRQSPTGA